MPHLSYSPNLIHNDFYFVSLMKKVLKGKHFASVEEVKQKMAEALKGIKIDKFKSRLEQCKKNVLIGVLDRMGSTFKVTEFKHARINTRFY